MFIRMIGKHLAIKQTNSGQEKQFSVMDKTDLEIIINHKGTGILMKEINKD